VVFGRAEKDEILALEPLNRREIFIFLPLTMLVIWYGIFPGGIFDLMDTSIASILDQIEPVYLDTISTTQQAVTTIGE
jgi:NADH-quinone oxidoreductase subunit M